MPSAESDAAACECFWTDPSTWLSAASCGYGSGYEPGSMQEWNPDCPVHPGDRAMLAVYTDAPSLHPTDRPRHRAGTHRASVPVDSCAICRKYGDDQPCLGNLVIPRHKAAS